MDIYCIAGLGADERLFKNLRIANATLKFINWVKPDKNDDISAYADKLIPQIDQLRSFSLLGVSLGGVLAVELSSKINPEKVFVISSVKSSKEFPFYFKWMRWMKVKYLISAPLLKSAKPLIELFFGKMSKADKKLINKMIDDADDIFTPWAAKAIIEWQSKDHLTPFNKIVQIIGDKDLIFRHAYITDCIVVKGGTHVMILDKASEISGIVEGELISEL
jgi:esterase/lipase